MECNSELESTRFAEIGHFISLIHDWLMRTTCADAFCSVSHSDGASLNISGAKETGKQKLRNLAAIDEKKIDIEERIQTLEACVQKQLRTLQRLLL